MIAISAISAISAITPRHSSLICQLHLLPLVMKIISLLKSWTRIGIVLIAFIIFIRSAHAATTPPILTAPSSGYVIATTSIVSIQTTFPQAALPNSKKLTFFDGTTSYIITLTDSAASTFNLNLSSVSSSANVSSTTANSIPNGTYTVSLSYQNSVADPVATVSNTNVKFDNATLAPTLTSPAPSTTYTSLLPIQFSIPETALSGSRKLTFTNGSGSIVLTLSDTTLTSFNLDPTQDPVGNSNVQSTTATSIPYGTYSVVFSYQDLFGNSVASSTSTSVVIASAATPTPTPTPAVTSSGGSSSGSGCGYIQDHRKNKPGDRYEPFVWMMICAAFVLLQRNKQNQKRLGS